MLVLSIIDLLLALWCVSMIIRDIRNNDEYVSGILMATFCLFLSVMFFLNYKGQISDNTIMNLGEASESTDLVI